MKKKYLIKCWLLILVLFIYIHKAFSQNFAPGTAILEEYGRRGQLLEDGLDSLIDVNVP